MSFLITSRHHLLSLLIAPLVILSLHIYRLPLLFIVLVLVVLLWRWKIFKGEWVFPNRFFRLLLVLFSIAGLVMFYQDWYSLEPMVSFLLMAFLLKLLEVKTYRDGIVILFVGYFLVATAFLFNQSILMSLGGIVVAVIITICLLQLQSESLKLFSVRSIRLASALLLQAIPIMLVLLFVFPRIGSLWSIPIQGGQSYTGVSDAMSPGDFTNLTRSREVAFRVAFGDEKIPQPHERYWRGLVLNQFDGRQWSRTQQFDKQVFDPSALLPLVKNNRLDYEIILEPTGEQWLYGISFAELDINQNIKRSSFNELFIDEPVFQRKKYRVSSQINQPYNESSEVLNSALLLPQGFNEKTLSQAQLWRREHPKARDFIKRVLSFYNQSFVYTLSPPTLGRNTVDDFLFSTQRGFCEHYASSFVVMMRAAGIPARVVVGYQGGEWNEIDEYMIVRQQDAHAWAEVWLSGEGWFRIDPTAAVAPERVELGLDGSLSDEDQALLDRRLLSSFTWVSRLALRWDSLNYRWQRWVLQYDNEQQSQFLEKLLGQITPARLAIALIAPAAVVLLLILITIIRQERVKPNEHELLFMLLTKRLKRHDVKVETGETLTEILVKAEKKMPQNRAKLQSIFRSMSRALYIQNNSDKQVYKAIKRQIKSL